MYKINYSRCKTEIIIFIDYSKYFIHDNKHRDYRAVEFASVDVYKLCEIH